jgi:hypothetical protein
MLSEIQRCFMTLTKPISIRIGPVILSVIIGFLTFAAPLHAEKTFAERLGWKAGDVVVILHVEDVGMSHSSNLGAILTTWKELKERRKSATPIE